MKKILLGLVLLLLIMGGIFYALGRKGETPLLVTNEGTPVSGLAQSEASQVLPKKEELPGPTDGPNTSTPQPNAIAPGDNLSDGREKDAELLAKIDQLFIIGFRGYAYDSAPDIRRALTETNLGGVILFDYDTPTKRYARNIQSETQLKKLIDDLESHAKTPLFISVDEEGGKVSRLKNVAGFTKTASAEYLGTESDASVRAAAATLGRQLARYGFNVDFAPVLDVNVNPDNPVIGGVDRSFSSDPDIVSQKGIAFMRGLTDAGLISVGKHFPGHGSSRADSHLGFVDITDTYQQYELDPFRDACRAGMPAVMVAHVYNKNVDTVFPATLSAKHIANLRNTAGCKSQLVISDDMDMRAITAQYGRKDALIRALNAGIDVLVISNNITGYDPEAFFKARKIIFDAVKSGVISEARINDAYDKVTAVKAGL